MKSHKKITKHTNQLFAQTLCEIWKTPLSVYLDLSADTPNRQLLRNIQKHFENLLIECTPYKVKQLYQVKVQMDKKNYGNVIVKFIPYRTPSIKFTIPTK